MARKLRLQFEGAIYHITVRGNGRARIFLDDRDRDRLLWRLCESRETFEIRLYLYCLMDNHFHLVVETPRANVSRFMQSVLTGYTVYFNLRHHRSGHVLQGRYGAQLVEGDRYLLNLSRYVHLNPVHAGPVKACAPGQKVSYLRAYRWSSYRGYIDPAKRNELIDCGPLLSLMHGRKAEQGARYRNFVESALVDTEDEFVELMKGRPRGIGGKEFRVWVDAEYKSAKEKMGSQEDVSFRREGLATDPEIILDLVAREFGVERGKLTERSYGLPVRPVAARLLCRHAGLTQREAGRRLGYGTGAAISFQLKRLGERLRDKDPDIGHHLARIEKKLRPMTRKT